MSENRNLKRKREKLNNKRWTDAEIMLLLEYLQERQDFEVDKYIWREESGQENINILSSTDGKSSLLYSSNSKVALRELSDRKCHVLNKDLEEIKLANNTTNNRNIETNEYISCELIKDSNFEYEEEWNIGGIPELLNELDADIEKSLQNIQTSKVDSAKPAINCRAAVFKELHTKPICKEEKATSRNLKSYNILEPNPSLEGTNSKSANLRNSISTFAGFSKGGHLISSYSQHFQTYSSQKSTKIGQNFKQQKELNDKDCPTSMSSQTGSNSSINISAAANNITSGQNNSGSNSTKQSNKMSIDHQATLDKGLKMKIKRTKPGTKTSEAKHEIVKATEQLQNGLTAGGTCSVNQDDNSSLILVSSQPSLSNSQNLNTLLGTTNNQGNSNSIGNKKNIGNCNNQPNNISSSSNSSGNISLNTGSANNSISQSTSLGTKRGSSGHRREKAKEKSSHSNRLGVDKNSTLNTEKEQSEKPLCHCNNADSSISACSNSSCIRKTESNTQRLSNSNTTTVPPGVFTPSTETSSSVTVSTANLMTVPTAVSTPISTQSISISGSANTPGPPSKDIITNSSSNVKISSHIAAQLAAAAASNTSANGSCISTTNYTNSDLKSLPNALNQAVKQIAPGDISGTVHHGLSIPNATTQNLSNVTETDNSISNSPIENSESPPAKRAKHTDCNITTSTVKNKEMIDICIGTSVGTITEPDCLGPCEPGTSVTLEGIVWHETEGGVLVVNVTWRGKTYVGTLLDCTRHDWAPPRFCDSPTEDLDSRTPKGRGKRGRAAITPDLSNFTETRSSIYFSHSHVHSKLRNGSSKSGRGTSRTSSVPPGDKINSGVSISSGNGGSTPSTSPTAFLPPRSEKRKSKDESSPSPNSGDNEVINNNIVNASGIPISVNTCCDSSNQPQSLINPVTGLNVQISTKKCKSSPCAVSPVLLECPEQDCSKKYKHVNGLRYHQSHAHGSASLLDEDPVMESEEQISTPLPSPLSSTPSLTANPSEMQLNTQIKTMSQSSTVSLLEDSNAIMKDEETNLQLEENEKACISDTITPSADLLKTESNSTVSNTNILAGSGSISAGTSPLEQKKFDLVPNTKINLNTLISIETNNQEIQNQSTTGKSGVLRFAQEETKVSNSATTLTDPQTISFESSVKPSISHEKTQQNTDNENYCNSEELSSKQKDLQQNQNFENECSNKVGNTISVAGKSKKNRKSPTPNNFDNIELNTCNITTREDVQSPAYSDISDDSTPVNEQDLIDKQNSKNMEVIKKSPEIGMTTGTIPPNSQSNVSSTLGNYGVYQFYQQQQFIVPATVDPQQSGKSNLNTANTITSPSVSQQHAVPESNNKKDSSIDVISKTNQHQINQSCLDVNKDIVRPLGGTSSSQANSELSSLGSGPLNTTTPPKPVSHFYAFNYMPSNYPFNVDPNYAPNSSMSTADDVSKGNRIPVLNANDQQQHTSVSYKDDRSKEDVILSESSKQTSLHVGSKQNIKSDTIVKSESIKQELGCSTPSQIPQHIQLQSKDHQGIGVYSNVYPRHALPLPSQQVSRDEELRRYYLFSDQQRRQNSSQSSLNQIQNSSTVSGSQQAKDDTGISQLNQHNQLKIKANSSLNIISKSGSTVSIAKGSPKHKQEEELKAIKQEGQKPTMETQGPPPPPTSQYFLHPSYIASTPFGFDPSHSMYRNVLMPTTSPYNTPPYHLPMPRYHSPEDLSRNTGTKALDALHHAASQYYTTHKIHELSERALKSPNNTNSNTSSTIKISGTSPNIGTNPHSSLTSNVAGHHALSSQPSGGTQLPHNLSSQAINISNKQDVIGSKSQGNISTMSGSSVNDSQKQSGINSSAGTNNNSNNANNVSSGSSSDSRSPPPQRHVHTHHHTHVGLGYPMYPAPYGAAVLASQQAAAVAVINPFPPGPNK